VNDAEAVRRAQGDPDAFEHIYRKYAPRLNRWVTQEVRSNDVALDIVAETFAQLLASAHRFRGTDDSAAAAWLDGIARNLVRRYVRRKVVGNAARRRLAISEELTRLPDSAEASSDNALEAALAALPRLERQAVELRVVHELPYADIAARLGARPDAVRARVSRGLRSLRAQLRGGST